jgi:hypothetical protein
MYELAHLMGWTELEPRLVVGHPRQYNLKGCPPTGAKGPYEFPDPFWDKDAGYRFLFDLMIVYEIPFRYTKYSHAKISTSGATIIERSGEHQNNPRIASAVAIVRAVIAKLKTEKK